MAQRDRYLIWFIAALLLVTILLPSSALAQSFSVSPAEVSIDGLSPGGEAEFNLTIHNKDDASHTFTLTTYKPEESQRRQGRAEFPDDSWVSFSPQELEVAANSDAKVKVMVAIPANQKWAGKDWEIWLGVKPKTSDLLVVNYYIRLLVSTSKEIEAGPNIAVVVGIVMGILLLGYGVYYLRRRTKPKHPQR